MADYVTIDELNERSLLVDNVRNLELSTKHVSLLKTFVLFIGFALMFSTGYLTKEHLEEHAVGEIDVSVSLELLPNCDSATYIADFWITAEYLPRWAKLHAHYDCLLMWISYVDHIGFTDTEESEENYKMCMYGVYDSINDMPDCRYNKKESFRSWVKQNWDEPVGDYETHAHKARFEPETQYSATEHVDIAVASFESNGPLMVWVYDGCATKANYVGEFKNADTEKYHYRCCNPSGGECESLQVCDSDPTVTYAEAVEGCQAIGKVVCSKEDLDSNCCSKGGACDDYQLWTSLTQGGEENANPNIKKHDMFNDMFTFIERSYTGNEWLEQCTDVHWIAHVYHVMSQALDMWEGYEWPYCMNMWANLVFRNFEPEEQEMNVRNCAEIFYKARNAGARNCWYHQTKALTMYDIAEEYNRYG